MTDTLLLILMALVVIAAAGSLWFAESRHKRRVTQRVSILAGATVRRREILKPLMRSKRRDPAALVDWVIGRHAPLAAPLPVSRLMALATGTVGAMTAYFVAHHFFGFSAWIVSLTTLGVFLGVPRFVCALSLSRQRFTLLDQMPDALGLLVRAARTGMPIAEGVTVVATESPQPTASEFLYASDAVSVGTPLEDALEKMAQRTGMAEYRFFVTAVTLQRETGGNLGETLDNLANTVRARKALRLKAKALTSEARSSIYVLVALPFVALGALTFLNPDYTSQLIDTQTGRSLLGAAGLLLTVGIVSMQMLMRRLG